MTLTRHAFDLPEDCAQPPYVYYTLTCDGCDKEHPERITAYYGDARVLPRGWGLQTTHRKNWPGYALGYDLCPDCLPRDAAPNQRWEKSWAPTVEEKDD